MKVQKSLTKLVLNKIIGFFCIYMLILSCGQKKPELVQVVINPYGFALNASEKSVLLACEKGNIDLMYEDSHSLIELIYIILVPLMGT
jgi:hypothetical protein